MGWLVGRVFKIRNFFLHEILMKYQEKLRASLIPNGARLAREFSTYRSHFL